MFFKKSKDDRFIGIWCLSRCFSDEIYAVGLTYIINEAMNKCVTLRDKSNLSVSRI